ncbi:hypothetical protein SAMN05216266_10247 [Amycolatopsis marina]|uniref:Uncharacterized protein n=1 Tax=Amycolatopsis marina TaxID=490629 RepID=A0A1I0WN21_9PSEU|nr:hypothetical protein SAMN05216266_10247 [Amycolatopsis marina]
MRRVALGHNESGKGVVFPFVDGHVTGGAR